jgi:uncharacterized protein YcfJ
MNIRNASLIRALGLLFGSACVCPVWAQVSEAEENISYAFADVLSAEPWYEVVETTRPVEHCEDRRVVRERSGNSGTGALVGAVVGGVAGSNVGSGSGRRAATVAGALIGGLVGNNAEANRSGGRERYVSRETECELIDEVATEQQLAGYEVQYRYRSEIYVSRLSYDPGSKLRIRIAVTPVDH